MTTLSKSSNAELIDAPTEEELEGIDIRLLSSVLKFRQTYFIAPREYPVDLLDLRVIFTLLVKRGKGTDTETLPFEAFQRAFERLFHVLQEEEPFDGRIYDENSDGLVEWSEFFNVSKQRNITIRVSVCERLFLTFNNPESSRLAYWVSLFDLLAILISSFCFIISTLPDCRTSNSCASLDYIERICLGIFTFEYFTKLITCWAVRTEVHDKATLQEIVVGYDPIEFPSALLRLFRFVRSPANAIDIAAISPGLMGLFLKLDGGPFVVLRLIRLTRIFRAFRNPALVAPLNVIGRTLQQSTGALNVLIFNFVLGLIIFGSLMYIAEGGDGIPHLVAGGRWNEELRANERWVGRIWNSVEGAWEEVWEKSPFQSIPHAFWWAIVTATTVGYGDDYPTTSFGRIVTVCTMLFSMVILVLPVGVLGDAFRRNWDSFHEGQKDSKAGLEKEVAFIVNSVKELNPSRLATLVLIEIWNEHPHLKCKEAMTRPTSSVFLGDVKLQLELPPDRAVTKELKLPVCAEPTILKRSVKGFLHVAYEWMPEKAPVQKGDDYVFSLHGSLTVTLKHASGLVNIDCTGGLSNPFCTVLCYPGYSPKRGPVPCLWRTGTEEGTLNPQWHASMCVDFAWELPGSPPPPSPLQESPEIPIPSGQPPLYGDSKDGKLSRQMTSSGHLDEVVGLLRKFAASSREQQVEMTQVREDLRRLSVRFDQISTTGSNPQDGISESPLRDAASRDVSKDKAWSGLPNCVPSSDGS